MSPNAWANALPDLQQTGPKENGSCRPKA